MNMENQATKMLKRSQKKLKEVSTGDCVAVFTSEFDRGKDDSANIISLVLEDRYKSRNNTNMAGKKLL